MTSFLKTICAAGVALSIATPVVAQDVYVGGAYDYGLPHSGDAESFGTFIAGVRFGTGALRYGFEGELGAPVGGDDVRETARLRAIGAYDFGSFIGLVSYGGTQYEEGGVNFSGQTFGFGAEVPITGGLTGRAEVIRDLMDDYPTNVTTTRLGVTYRF